MCRNRKCINARFGGARYYTEKNRLSHAEGMPEIRFDLFDQYDNLIVLDL